MHYSTYCEMCEKNNILPVILCPEEDGGGSVQSNLSSFVVETTQVAPWCQDSMVVGTCAWGHAGHVGDLGALEGQPDVWWGQTCVWVGPVMWGVVEARHWGSCGCGHGCGCTCCAVCPWGEGALGVHWWSQEHGGGTGTCVLGAFQMCQRQGGPNVLGGLRCAHQGQGSLVWYGMYTA